MARLNVPRAAGQVDEADVMREQLEYLIEHVAAKKGICVCSDLVLLAGG